MEEIDSVDSVVVGAGVVGLAVAAALAARGHEVLILESERAIGTGTSSRNSEVIHAGIYYTPGSLKARLCVQGNARLYAYAQQRHIAHRRCGKLIVATSPAEVPKLTAIQANAAANGAPALEWLDAAAAREREPALRCEAALLSPSTGIIDSHALMLSLLADAEHQGALLALGTRVRHVRPQRHGSDATGTFLIDIDTDGPSDNATPSDGDDPPTNLTQLRAKRFFNCAGLHAPQLAGRIDGLPAHARPTAYYAKGRYFSCSAKAPFRHLIYPVPQPGGLGVHLTLDLAGQARFGPDVQWIDRIEYAVDPHAADGFYDEVRRYWPDLPDQSLQPAYAGIRPKISGPGEAAADFRIDGPSVHGVPGLVNLFGIESPGLTSSLALADYVIAQLADV